LDSHISHWSFPEQVAPPIVEPVAIEVKQSVAPGEKTARQPRELSEVELVDRPSYAVAPSCATQPIGVRKELEILDDREIAVERKLLGDITEPLAGGGARAAEVDAGYA
jgi:hypothetical protein